MGLARKIAVGLGERHDATKNVRVKLGECAMNAKKYKSAIHAFTKLLDGKLDPEIEFNSRVKQFGKVDMRYAKALNGLAGIFERLDRDEEALKLMREASAIAVELFGPEDPTAKQARQNVEGMQSHIKAKGNVQINV